MTDTETTTETITYEVPTVAKANEMINKYIDGILFITDAWDYKFSPLTITSNNKYFGSSGYNVPEEYKLFLVLLQTTSDKKVITVRDNDGIKILGTLNYTLDYSNWGEMPGTDLLYNSAKLDISKFIYTSSIEYNTVKIYYGDELMDSFPVYKTSTKISKNLMTSIEYNFYYTIDSLTPSQFGYLFGTFAYYNNSSVYNQTKASYQIKDTHTIYLKLLQDNTNKPTIQIRTGDTVLYTFNYNLSSEFKEVNYYFLDTTSTSAYEAEANIDVSSIIINTNNNISEMKLCVDQNGTFQDVVALPMKKIITLISKPDDNTILAFGALRDLIYPPGAIYLSTNNDDPSSFIGGTWKTITSPISNSYAYERTL